MAVLEVEGLLRIEDTGSQKRGSTVARVLVVIIRDAAVKIPWLVSLGVLTKFVGCPPGHRVSVACELFL